MNPTTAGGARRQHKKRTPPPGMAGAVRAVAELRVTRHTATSDWAWTLDNALRKVDGQAETDWGALRAARGEARRRGWTVVAVEVAA